jgi:hypothetical protein
MVLTCSSCLVLLSTKLYLACMFIYAHVFVVIIVYNNNNNNNNFIHNKIPILVYNEYITLNKKYSITCKIVDYIDL